MGVLGWLSGRKKKGGFGGNLYSSLVRCCDEYWERLSLPTMKMKHEIINNAVFSILQPIVALIESKIVYTQGHSERVARVSMNLASVMGVGEDEMQHLLMAAMLHDIGMLGINNTPLEQLPAATEWKFIKQHPIVGDEILKPIESLTDVRYVIRHHHERQDGKGYPDGLDRSELKTPVNILIVAEAYATMNANNAYRRALKHDEILDLISINSGTQFAPEVVEALWESNNSEFNNIEGFSNVVLEENDWVNNEKRRALRFDICLDVELRLENYQEVIRCHSGNLSTNGYGIMLIADKNVPPTSKIYLRIFLPETSLKPIKCEGKVAYCFEELPVSENFDKYKMGIAINDIEKDEHERLCQFIAQRLASF